jgi:hypothetical protein
MLKTGPVWMVSGQGFDLVVKIQMNLPVFFLSILYLGCASVPQDLSSNTFIFQDRAFLYIEYFEDDLLTSIEIREFDFQQRLVNLSRLDGKGKLILSEDYTHSEDGFFPDTIVQKGNEESFEERYKFFNTTPTSYKAELWQDGELIKRITYDFSEGIARTEVYNVSDENISKEIVYFDAFGFVTRIERMRGSELIEIEQVKFILQETGYFSYQNVIFTDLVNKIVEESEYYYIVHQRHNHWLIEKFRSEGGRRILEERQFYAFISPLDLMKPYGWEREKQ